jgi:HD-GYP domain-containing protein (c-di-GMP phosphodiesterase class II)
MISDRPYRKAMGSEAAFDELKKNSGIQFDKEIVDTFIKVYQEKVSIA